MGFADRDTLLVVLNQLLEAERAGTRIALQIATISDDPELTTQMMALHHDEARWCAVLTRAIVGLQGEPWTKTGDFYEKVMALPELPERLALLRRGQAWVARKIREISPRVGDTNLFSDLSAMLAAHDKTDRPTG